MYFRFNKLTIIVIVYFRFSDQWDEFPSAEDWDNEEYTGSLAESKVFTASTQPQSAAGVNSTPTDTGAGVPSNLQTDAASNGLVGSTNHIGKTSLRYKSLQTRVLVTDLICNQEYFVFPFK